MIRRESLECLRWGPTVIGKFLYLFIKVTNLEFCTYSRKLRTNQVSHFSLHPRALSVLKEITHIAEIHQSIEKG